jgi:hypothetical protein
MESYIRDRQFTFHSKRLLEELRVFIWMHGKAQAQNGYNDDLVMSLGMGLFVRDTAMKFHAQSMDLSRQVIGGMTKTGIDGPVYHMPNGFSNPYQVEIGGQIEDITWLLG